MSSEGRYIYHEMERGEITELFVKGGICCVMLVDGDLAGSSLELGQAQHSL